ncbi:hypothetical protein N657DRAFT_654459 [Parathielavia appendiculata]|uniref:SMODS and SLOG-associating 2TM effector domain-containing protein n=1 Tax=Parathielavia appendiculata TaxID=2587402 RepID=A0AAN6U3V6_9PEZI|nr:hypothetical protein N657DRAFT_654459 [Parathielavia appendiculata]
MSSAPATSNSKIPFQVQTAEIGLGFDGPLKSDTDLSWGAPAGLPIRRLNDENLVIFRRAVGINSTLAGSTDPESLEEGRKKAVGIYRSALTEVRRKKVAYRFLSFLINASHFAQIIIGASLTALGPTAGDHVIVITILGAINTVLAGVLALIKGQGLPDRIYHDQSEYRRLQDWIEQTEALLAVGVIGRDRKEVGVLVQMAFKKYNAAKQCEESNLPENYVRLPETDQNGRPISQGSASPPLHHRSSSP